MKNYICALLAVVMASCSNGEQPASNIVPTGDNLAVTLPDSGFDATSFKRILLPLRIDTTFISHADTSTLLTYQEVRAMGAAVLDHELFSGLSSDIATYCKIDSLKQAGQYAAYLEKLDIGMVKTALAFKLGVVALDHNTDLFLWCIRSQSYDACPFFSGTAIIATWRNKNAQPAHFLIGSIFDGADPPSMFGQRLTATIDASGTIGINNLAVSDDEDLPGEETTRQTLKVTISAEKISVTQLHKEVKNTEAAEAN